MLVVSHSHGWPYFEVWGHEEQWFATVSCRTRPAAEQGDPYREEWLGRGHRIRWQSCHHPCLPSWAQSSLPTHLPLSSTLLHLPPTLKSLLIGQWEHFLLATLDQHLLGTEAQHRLALVPPLVQSISHW